jgi:hypothetical protein
MERAAELMERAAELMERGAELIVVEFFIVTLLSLENGLSWYFTTAKCSNRSAK